MLTMQRRTEIGGMPTSEFKHNARQIEIDGSRTKNGKGSIIPLSDAAFDILNKHYDPDRKFMFGDADTGYQGWSKSKEELDAIVKIDKHWIFHDFRRTGKTAMEDDLDVPDKVSEAILNHAKKGLDKVYNGAKYVRQKREALVLYAAHVMKIVAIDDAASQDDAA
jgi:integrase